MFTCANALKPLSTCEPLSKLNVNSYVNLLKVLDSNLN